VLVAHRKRCCSAILLIRMPSADDSAQKDEGEEEEELDEDSDESGSDDGSGDDSEEDDEEKDRTPPPPIELPNRLTRGKRLRAVRFPVPASELKCDALFCAGSKPRRVGAAGCTAHHLHISVVCFHLGFI
jgi:hypothetical protein